MQLLSMMAMSSEFGQMAIREEELPELDSLARDACHFDIKGGPENKHGKVNILLQVSKITTITILVVMLITVLIITKPRDIKGGPENKYGKVNILLQVRITIINTNANA